VQSSDSTATDFNLNLNAALNTDASLYGRYSTVNDQRFGLSSLFDRNETHRLSLQLEGTYNSNSQFGFSGGAFETVSLSALNLAPFSIEAGAALAYTPVTEVTTLPLSIKIFHEPDHSGFGYGIALRGQVSPSDNQNEFSFELLGSYFTHNLFRYDLSLSLPLSASDSENSLTLRFGLSIPLGASAEVVQNEIHTPEFSEGETRNYNLNAKITSLNEALFLLKINKGSSDSIAKGQTFDIYSGETLMARAQVVSVKLDEAALSVIEYKQEHWIELGFLARRLAQ
jgi:hypothetical protein